MSKKSAPRRLDETEAKAFLRVVSVSARKEARISAINRAGPNPWPNTSPMAIPRVSSGKGM